jgi:hypothetical protein
MTDREKILDLCRRSGVTRITAEYAGYSDSGSIDEPEFEPSGALNPNAYIDSVPSPWQAGKMIERKVVNIIADIFYQLLEQAHPGWEINDGSQGMFTWDIATNKIALEHGENYTSTENYSHEF